MKNRFTGRSILIGSAAALSILAIALATFPFLPDRQGEPLVDFSDAVKSTSLPAISPPPLPVAPTVEPTTAGSLVATDVTALPANSGATPQDLHNRATRIRESLARRQQEQDLRSANLIAESLQSAYGPFIRSLRVRGMTEDDINMLTTEMGAIAFEFHQRYMSIYADEGLSDHLLEVDTDFPAAFRAVLETQLNDEQIEEFEDFTLQRAQVLVTQPLLDNGLTRRGTGLLARHYMNNFVVADSHVVGGPEIATLLGMQKRLVALEQAYKSESGSLSQEDSLAASAYLEKLTQDIRSLDSFMTQAARRVKSQEEAAASACALAGTC